MTGLAVQMITHIHPHALQSGINGMAEMVMITSRAAQTPIIIAVMPVTLLLAEMAMIRLLVVLAETR